MPYAPYRIPRIRVGDMVDTEAPLTCCGRTMTTYQPFALGPATHGCVSCGTRVDVDDTGRIRDIRR